MSTSSLINRVSNSSSKISKSKIIEKIVFGGSGLTRDDGCVIFVPFSAPGDEVTLKVTQAKKSYKIAQVDRILKPSPSRISPRCPHFQKCGGCQLQHITYEAQIEAKRSFVSEALGTDVEVVESPSPWLYRSHIRCNLKKERKGFSFGFIGVDNRSLISISSCPLFSDNEEFFNQLKEYLASLSNQGIQSGSFRLFKVEDGFVVAFSFFPRIPKNPLPFAKGVSFKSPGKEIHLGDTTIKTNILDLPIQFSPYGFMQNNLPMSEKLYQTVIDWIGDTPKKVLDLYCGVGVTSTLLSRKGHDVIGVESNKEALKQASEARFICGHVEHVLPKLLDSFKPDAILVNPTRTGLSKEVRLLLEAQELIYISCMPSTLKRDVEELHGRYERVRAQAFDMFPQTTHIETVLQMKRGPYPKD